MFRRPELTVCFGGIMLGRMVCIPTSLGFGHSVSSTCVENRAETGR